MRRVSRATKKGDIPPEMRTRVVRLAKAEIQRRLAHGAKQKQLEAEWGISQSTISEWMGGGEKLGLGLILKLRDALQMPLDELLGLPPLRVNASARKDSVSARVESAVQMNDHVAEIAGAAEPARVRGAGDRRRRPRGGAP